MTGATGPELRALAPHQNGSPTTIIGPPTSGALTLTLNAPLRFSGLDAEVTLLPGCDGRWGTCEGKFGNTVRYGAHRFALRNLAIKALEVPQVNGGKK